MGLLIILANPINVKQASTLISQVSSTQTIKLPKGNKTP